MIIGLPVFLIAASPGILPIYYEDVSFAVVNGVSMLVKVYGPLHPVYLVYLLGYFLAMVAVIVHSQIRQTIETTAHAVIVAIAVFVNIGVWLIEQLVRIDFEMLSISYIISELFLLSVHLVTNENQQLRDIVRQVESVQNRIAADDLPQPAAEGVCVPPERIEIYIAGIALLTPTEKAVYDA